MYLILVGLFLIFSPAYAESIPDYDKPYAPIFTDKSVYSWTDKIIVSIMAPSWNSNSNQIDSIGQIVTVEKEKNQWKKRKRCLISILICNPSQPFRSSP